MKLCEFGVENLISTVLIKATNNFVPYKASISSYTVLTKTMLNSQTSVQEIHVIWLNQPSIWEAVCSRGRLEKLMPSPWPHWDLADSGGEASSAISGFSALPHLPLGAPLWDQLKYDKMYNKVNITTLCSKINWHIVDTMFYLFIQLLQNFIFFQLVWIPKMKTKKNCPLSHAGNHVYDRHRITSFINMCTSII